MGNGQKYPQAQRKEQSYILVLAFGCLVFVSAIFNETRGKIICSELWSINAHTEQERSELKGTGHCKGIQKCTTAVTANGQVQANEKAQVYVYDLDLFVTVQFLETLADLLLGKLSEDHGSSYQWTGGQTPQLIKNGRKHNATRTTMHRSLSQDYHLVLPLRPEVHLQHR